MKTVKTTGPGPIAASPAVVEMPLTSPYLTIEEAAVYGKTTEWAIAQAIRARDLQAKKIGKRFLTTRQWFDEWFNRQEDAA